MRCNSPYSCERFWWGEEETLEEGNLKSRALSGHGVGTCYCRYYNYDKKGNITEDWLVGNLRGIRNNPIHMQKKGKPDTESTDFFLKKCKYSDDGLNLLIEKDEHGLVTQYDYHPGTDLVESKYILKDGKIQIREFFLYDGNAALKLHIIDDGFEKGRDNCGDITERKITEITNTDEPPYGLPRIIEEFALDIKTGNKVFLGKKVNHINSLGQIYQQDVYDDQNHRVYSLTWEYDPYGNVVMEKNAIGEVITRKYDLNNNLEYEWGPNKDYYKGFATDKMNRRTREEEIHTDGRHFTKTYQYDKRGNKTSEIDIYGNITLYDYDEFNRVIQATLPPVADETDTVYYPQIHYDYDIFGNITAVTDPLKRTTRTAFTLNGKPYERHDPDGNSERWEYSVRGELKAEFAKDGSFITYEHDFASRPTLIQFFNKNGEPLKTIEKTYSAFHLKKEVENGITTTYSYDVAGRLSKIEKNNQLTTYVYDALGREIERHEYFGDDYINYVKKYDLLNRVTEESEQDSKGEIFRKVNYKYDVDGNRRSIKTENQAGINETIIDYNSHGQPILQIDAYGNETRTSYDYSYLNEYGVIVPYSEETDPLGNKTIIIQDALGRVARIKKQNISGKTTQQAEFHYDRAGNKQRHVERVVTPDQPDRLILHVWTYDEMNRVRQITEAVARPEGKVTFYDYDLRENIKELKQPNGITIYYDYDSLDRLRTRHSSDFTIHETYEYDANNHLKKVTDTSGETILDYDSNHNLEKEQLSNGFSLKYEYDRLGRIVKTFYPDASAVVYIYKGSRLEKIIRQDALSQPLYEHSYTYDLSGNVVKAKLPAIAVK